jgi:hypothetical protein
MNAGRRRNSRHRSRRAWLRSPRICVVGGIADAAVVNGVVALID